MTMLWGLNCDSNLALVQGYPSAFDVSRFAPDILRYPGGSWSNYFDWTSGWAFPGHIAWADAPYSAGKSFMLEDLARMFPPPMRILWTLNVLTDTLESQIAMLQHAASLGYAIEFVELGNELRDSSDALAVWPTGADYMSGMVEWITALRAEFQGIKICACGSWDNDWTSGLTGDFDAIALHIYSNAWGHDFDEGFAIDDFIYEYYNAIKTIPNNKPVWVTEYGSMSVDWNTDTYGPQQGTITQAEIQVRMRDILLNMPRVEIAILHELFGIHVDSFGLYNGASATPSDGITAFGELMLTAIGADSVIPEEAVWNEPITLEELKAHAVVEHTLDDVLLSSLITAAREECENIMNRIIVRRMFTMIDEEFSQSMYLPIVGADTAVSWIHYYDNDNVTHVLPTQYYLVDSDSEPAKVMLAYGYSWPNVYSRFDAVQIGYMTGWVDMSEVPEAIKTWIKIRAASLYEQRENFVAGTSLNMLPDSFTSALLGAYMVGTLSCANAYEDDD